MAGSPPQSPEELFSIARQIAMTAQPWMLSCLLHMVYRLDDRVVANGMPTMGVTANGQLLAHPLFLTEVVPRFGGAPALAFVLLHEAWHILRKHPARAKALRDRTPGFDEQASGLAMDITINPGLRELSRSNNTWKIAEPKLEDGTPVGVFPSDFGLPDDCGLTYEQLYDLVLKKLEEQRQGGEGDEGNSGKQGMPTAGCSPELGPQGEEIAKDLPRWSEAKLEEVIRSTLDAAKKQNGLRPGSVPVGMVRALEEALLPSKVDWREATRCEVVHSLDRRKGQDETDYTRTSILQGGLGWGPGCPRLAGRMVQVPRIALVRDTSGSMYSANLRVASETVALLETLEGELRVVDIDTEVHDHGDITSTEEARKLVGHGGTHLTPALDLLATARPAYDLAVLVTDGYVGSIGSAPPFRVLILLTTDYTNDLQYAVDEGWARILKVEE